MNFTFEQAKKKQIKARVAIDGPSGAGKTYTALVLASSLAGDKGKIAVIDTERGSAKLYADKFTFDVLELDTFSPEVYTQAIEAAESAGYSVIVIDSLTHAWEGEGGALELVDKASARVQGNSYVAWRDVTPLHRRMVDAMLQSKCHVVATMRSKMDYVQEKDEKSGRTVIRKVGMAPIQRQGMEYEFTLVGDMDVDHKFIVSKSRCDIFADFVKQKPTVKDFMPFVNWLDEGDKVKTTPKSEPVKPAMTAEQAMSDLGFETPKKAEVKSGGAMTYEEAAQMKGANGEAYGTLNDVELKGKRMGLTKLVNNPDTDHYKQSAALNKLEAINILLAVPESERLERAGQEKLI